LILKNKLDSYLFILSWLILIGVATTFIFKVTLHSDLLFFDVFVEDLMRFDGFISDWKFPAAPAIFPDVILYSLSYFIFDNVVFRVAFVCFFQSIILAWACVYLGSIVRLELSYAAKSLILLLVALVIYVSIKSNMWLFFNSTNNHFASLLCSLIGFAWLIQYIRLQHFRYLLGITLVTFIGAISTSLIALTFTIPLTLITVFYMFFCGQECLKKILPSIVALILGNFMAAVALPWLLPFSASATKERLSFSIDRLGHGANMLREAFSISFALDNLHTFFLSLLFVVIFIYLIVKLSRLLKAKKSEERNFWSVIPQFFNKNVQVIFLLFLYWIFATFVTVFGSLFTGAFVDPWGFRYFSLPLCLIVLIWVISLDISGILKRRELKLIIILGLVFCSFLVAQTWQKFLEKNKSLPHKALFSGTEIYSNEVTCLKEAEANGFALASGVGDYWSSRGLRYRLSNKNYILPILNDGKIFFHMMGLGPLETPSKYGADFYNFAILNKSNSKSHFNLTPEILGKILPKPTVIKSCNDSVNEIWIYADHVLDTFIKSRVNQLLFDLGKPRSSYTSEASNLPGIVVVKKGLMRVADQGVDKIGFLTYGPYIKLLKGRYTLAFEYESTADGNKWDYGVFSGLSASNISLGEGYLGRSSDGFVKQSFEIDRDIDRFEIRTWYGGQGRLTVKGIQIRREP
jgi:hypothetical protein